MGWAWRLGSQKIEVTVNKAVEKPVAKVEAVEKARAETALAGGEQFMVPAGAYVDPAGVIEKYSV